MRPFGFIPVFACVLSIVTPTVLGQDQGCNCTDCTDSATVLLGTFETILSPECEEGSVASLEKLYSVDDSGEYQVITWNAGVSYLSSNFVSTYKYAVATQEEDNVQCYQVPEENLPVIGDQPTIQVTLNCESTKCDFRYSVEFGCYPIGVLVTDAGGGLQVLSDVDDTIVCPNPQGSTDPHSIAGVDTRLEAKEIYPGVAELMLGLALGPEETTSTTINSNNSYIIPARPMLLSARPREAFLLLSIAQDSAINVYMEEVGQRNSNPTWGTNIDGSMYGTLLDGTSYNEFGETKAKSYTQVATARPNTRFAFLGDNGQGDVCAAQSMLQSAAKDRMMAVLIHLTQTNPEESITTCEDPETGDFTLDLPESDVVHYHSTHADAALWVYNQKLISCCSAQNVHGAIEEWIACRCDGMCNYELPTGVSVPATRNETLAYCDTLKADQALLQTTIDTCDPEGGCPQPEGLPAFGNETSSSSSSSDAATNACHAPSVLLGLLLLLAPNAFS